MNLQRKKLKTKLLFLKKIKDFEPDQGEDDTGSMKRFKRQEDGLSKNGEKILIKLERKDI